MRSRLWLNLAFSVALYAFPLFSVWAAPGVSSVSKSDDIRDIRDPFWTPDRRQIWALGVAIATAGLGIAYLMRRSRRRPLTASERALARLQAAAPLASAGQARSYAEAASEAIRDYLVEKFGLPATHRTTEEFFEELLVSQPPPIGPYLNGLSRFLGACDLAKFSLVKINPEDMTSLNASARQFVLDTATNHPGSRS